MASVAADRRLVLLSPGRTGVMPAPNGRTIERMTLHVGGRVGTPTPPVPDRVELERMVTQTVVERLERSVEKQVREQLRPNSEQMRQLAEHIYSDLHQQVVLEAERTGSGFGR